MPITPPLLCITLHQRSHLNKMTIGNGFVTISENKGSWVCPICSWHWTQTGTLHSASAASDCTQRCISHLHHAPSHNHDWGLRMARDFLSAFQIWDILLQSLQFLCVKQTPYNPLSTAEIVDPAQDGRNFTGGRYNKHQMVQIKVRLPTFKHGNSVFWENFFQNGALNLTELLRFGLKYCFIAASWVSCNNKLCQVKQIMNNIMTRVEIFHTCSIGQRQEGCWGEGSDSHGWLGLCSGKAGLRQTLFNTHNIM